MESMNNSVASDDPVPRKKMKTTDLTSSDKERLGSPKPKFKFARPKVFMSSGGWDNTVAKAVEKLGGKVSTSGLYDSSVTHIIAVKMTPSETMLCCIAAGTWVLHPDYVTSSLAAGRWLFEERYEWGNTEANFLSECSSEEVKLAKAAMKWRTVYADGKFAGAFCGIRASLYLLDEVTEKKSSLRSLIESGGGSVLDVCSDPSSPTHCFREQKFLHKFGHVDCAGLAARGIPVLDPIFLSEALTELGRVRLEDYLLEDYKFFWENTFTPPPQVLPILSIAKVRDQLADIEAPTSGLKSDHVQRLLGQQQVRQVNDKELSMRNKIESRGRKLWLAGNDKFNIGQDEESIELYTRALKFINNESFTNPSITDVYSSRSNAFLREDRHHEALDDAIVVAAHNPQDFQNLLRAIRCYLILGDIQLGKQCLSKIPHGESYDHERKFFTDKFRQHKELKETVSKHFEIKDYLYALETIDEGLAISPGATYFITMKAKCLVYQKKALSNLRNGIYSKDARNYAWGLIYYCKGKLDEAIDCMQEAKKDIPEASSWIDRANTLKNAHLNVDDLELYGGGDIFNEISDLIPTILNKRAAVKITKEDFKGALEDATKVLSIVPGQAEAIIKCVQCHLALGNTNEARITLDIILDTVIKNSYVKKLNKVEEQRILILDLMNQGLYDKAVDKLVVVRKAYQKSLDLALLLAECFAMQVKISGVNNAIRLLEAFDNEENQENPHFLFVKGICYYYKSNLKDATKMFKKAVSIASNNWLQFSRVLTKASMFALKSTAMNKVFEDAENDKKLGNKLKALSHYTLGLGMDPNNKTYLIKVHLCRAEVYNNLEKYSAAIYDFEKAIDINPECHEAWAGKGKVHMQNANFKEAIHDFERAYNLKKKGEYKLYLKRAKRMFRMKGNKTHYDVLGISQNTTEEQIRKAYRNKAKEFHPDKHMNGSEDDRQKMEAMMKDISAAQRCLSDPIQRRKYDRTLDREENDTSTDEDSDSEDEYFYQYEYYGYDKDESNTSGDEDRDSEDGGSENSKPNDEDSQ